MYKNILVALSRYANQYKHELKNTPLTLNQQLNNIKLNNIGLNSPLLSMSNSDSTFNQQNFNSLLTMDMMPHHNKYHLLQIQHILH